MKDKLFVKKVANQSLEMSIIWSVLIAMTYAWRYSILEEGFETMVVLFLIYVSGIYTNLKPLSLYIEDPGAIKNAICEDHELAELCQHVSYIEFLWKHHVVPVRCCTLTNDKYNNV